MLRKAEDARPEQNEQNKPQKQEELSKIEIIPNINELEDALCEAGGTTTNQVETAKIHILKQQLEVLNLCGKRLTLSHKGQKKTSKDLFRELLIQEEEEKGQTESESALPF